MRAIIAVNNLGYIGLRNTLIWNCKSDLQHFKKLTDGQTLLVGHNTSKDLPELSNRTIIVDDRKRFKTADWCIGGKKTYEKYCHLFTEIHISRIDNNDIGDTLFPNLQNINPYCKIFTYCFEED